MKKCNFSPISASFWFIARLLLAILKVLDNFGFKYFSGIWSWKVSGYWEVSGHWEISGYLGVLDYFVLAI